MPYYSPPDVRPSYYRLSEDSWAQIRESYRQGATARELAIRWKVSPGSIYRHACEGGWTKKASGDAVAREHAAAIAAEQAADEAPPVPAPAPVPAFAPAPGGDRCSNISEAFDRTLAAMDRAVMSGRASEALTLGKLLQVLEQLDRELMNELGGGGGVRSDEDDLDGPDPDHAPKTDVELMEEQARKAFEARETAGVVWPYIEKAAWGMLRDETTEPAIYSRVVMRWRAEHFGPEVARADWRRCVENGVDGRIYDKDGNILDGFVVV